MEYLTLRKKDRQYPKVRLICNRVERVSSKDSVIEQLQRSPGLRLSVSYGADN